MTDIAPERCARCGVLGHDRRTLWMACFYAMSELGVPFEEVGVHGVVLDYQGRDHLGLTKFAVPGDEWERRAYTRGLFTLRVCKGCRGEWMTAIETWFRAPPGDASRWNSDASTYGQNDSLATLLADTERMRTELVSLEQRVEAARGAALAERDRREAEDRTRAEQDGRE